MYNFCFSTTFPLSTTVAPTRTFQNLIILLVVHNLSQVSRKATSSFLSYLAYRQQNKQTTMKIVTPDKKMIEILYA